MALAFAYAAFTGWGVPAQRTCWMLVGAAASVLLGRHRAIAPVLALAAAVVVFADPWAPLAPGFWLSFAAVAAIVAHAQVGRRRRPGALLSATRTQWAVTVAMVPLGAVFFSSFSVLGPLANAFAIPLVSFVVTPLALAGAGLVHAGAWLPLGALGEILLGIAALATEAMLDLLGVLSALSASVHVIASPTWPLLGLGVVGCAIMLSPSRRVTPVLGGLMLMPMMLNPGERPAPGQWWLTALDVGQGSAVLIETTGYRLLYDAGPGNGRGAGAGTRIIVPYLRSRGIGKIDTMVLSHADSDHVGGAAGILRELVVDTVSGSLAPEHPLRESRPAWRDCIAGTHWSVDGVRFEFLHPASVEDPGPAMSRSSSVRKRWRTRVNGRSCVLRVSSRAGSALITGDIEAAQEAQLLERTKPEQLGADVLVAPHHGSRTSSTLAFLLALGSRHAVFQVGYRNRYRHPDARVLERYRALGQAIWRSDRDGALQFRFRPGQPPAVTAMRPASRAYWRIRLPRDSTGGVGVPPGH
ncbi:MAG: DNA internalization-related competence protein ComEC/Rec2 [Burkholderiaceae bacterium]